MKRFSASLSRLEINITFGTINSLTQRKLSMRPALDAKEILILEPCKSLKKINKRNIAVSRYIRHPGI